MYNLNYIVRITLAGIILGFLLSCSATLNPNKFTDGENNPTPAPELTVSAASSFNTEQESIINIGIDIDAGSLIYKIRNRSLVAQTGIQLEIVNARDNSVALSQHYNVKIRKTFTSDMNALGTHKLNKQFKLPAGEYSVRVSATDKSTGEKTMATAKTRIKNPVIDSPFLTDIQLYGYNPKKDHYEAINDYHLSASFDTLRFIVQVAIPGDVEEPLQMESSLIQFASDTLPARPMGDANYSESSIQYKGVNYYKRKNLQTINRTLLPDSKNLTVEFNYPRLERGNYRFDVHLGGSAVGNEQHTRRDFGIRREYFPALTHPREKAKSLVYLMGGSECEKLLAVQNPDSLQNAVEQFWYNHIKPKSKGREVREQYYSRVAIANKEFSNFKEGWKTDQGMIFVLFGNPWIIDEDLSKETWFYSYNRFDETKKFTFHRTKVYSNSYPFHNYILQRKFDYNNVLYQQKQLWLKGTILTTPI